MTLRRIAATLVAFGLVLGLVGAGISATFSDGVTAVQNIEVGTLACEISATTAGTISSDRSSVTYDAPRIVSSAAGSAPFTFTVAVTGDIPAKLHVTKTTPPAPFTSILGNPGDVTLGQGGTHAYAAGLQWPALENGDMGQTASITYTVDCLEGSAVLPNAPMASTNAINQTKSPQWANVTAVPGSGTVLLTLHQNRSFASCFEWRTDGDTNQKLSDTNFGPGINDGLYPYKCLSAPGTFDVPLGPTIGYVEFRMVFGAEGDERFDWTRVDALP